MGGGDTKGYFQHICWCVRCQHNANVDPARIKAGARPVCSRCGSREYTVRLVWTPGELPDNVTVLRKK